jgi:hypothetical protein
MEIRPVTVDRSRPARSELSKARTVATEYLVCFVEFVMLKIGHSGPIQLNRTDKLGTRGELQASAIYPFGRVLHN